MKRNEKIKILSRLGVITNELAHKRDWKGSELGLNEGEYNDLLKLIEKVNIYNTWFTPDSVRQALLGISKWLNEDALRSWLKDYELDQQKPKRVALIMAGNIPLVGFHDFLSVYLSGNRPVIKLSSEDKHLFPALLKTLALFDNTIIDSVEIYEEKIGEFEAVIATGSNNSATYFESYFGSYPNIIRKNRKSIAILDGNETDDELRELGNDIFTFYGLGCRNVTQIWIPENYNLDRFFEAIYDFNAVIHHNKYANNYDYNKAVNLMNQEEILDNGFLLLKEDLTIHSPLGMLHYVRYTDEKSVCDFINQNKDEIQAVVGKKYLSFGQAQRPELSDYADGVDTMKFLTEL
ncbi:acyl-CoA reductase [bacterium AH-315-C20]|nr:acyl-CoA reductase [bacterium AH-315-C20]